MKEKASSVSYDPLLLVLILSLAGLGLVMLLSASTFLAEKNFGDPYYFFNSQAKHLLIGLGLMLVLSRIPYQLWAKLAYPFFGIVLFGLVLVLIPGIGQNVNGASRWLRIPGISVQPSELAKLAIIFYMAYSLTQKGERSKSFTYGLFPHLMVLGVTAVLILLEPDLGTAVIVILVALTMMIIAGTKISHLLILAAAAAPIMYHQIINYPYRMRRITAFLDPWSDPQNMGYHIIHSFYAFASGGLWGQGPGASQQKLFFMPEPHTDFIFSVVAEEMGLMGVSVVAAMFLALILRGLTIAKSAKDLCGVYMAVGCVVVVGLPAFLNMAVAMALLPTKGLPLPFFSHGGTNLLVCCAAMGVLLNIASQSRLTSGLKHQVKTNAAKAEKAEKKHGYGVPAY